MNARGTHCENARRFPLEPESDRLDDYLAYSAIIDWRAPAIVAAARGVTSETQAEVAKAKCLFEWVRDNVSHSCDACDERVTCRASDVLRLRTGLCFAKSHLLAAMLRAVGVPAGFCYQRLRYGDGSARMILHGLCGVYLKSGRQWIRVDPRGNKPGVDAQFRLGTEQIAFRTDTACGEVLYRTVFVEPLPSVITCLTASASVSEALAQLPDALAAKTPTANGESQEPEP